MGHKSRGNYSSFCMRFDCVSQKCAKCYRYSEFKRLDDKAKKSDNGQDTRV